MSFDEPVKQLPEIKPYLRDCQARVDRYLDELLPQEEAHPKVIHAAMRYSVFAGGKRLRPALCLATAEALERPVDVAMPLAAALELVHTYSLIHDDLPALDDDDTRRGKPTLHKQFGEGIAILGGNALLTLAFEHLAAHPREASAESRARVVELLARAVGTRGGMIAGQVVDLLTQGRSYSAADVQYIHECKTGALINASVSCTALLFEASAEESAELSAFSSAIGLAFQVIDDVLDVDGSSQEMGKESGKDHDDQKATYPGLFGVEESKQIAADLVSRAVEHLSFLGARGGVLEELARFISVRRY